MGVPVASKKTKIINTRVAGVSFVNPDGTERQDIIKELTMGERVLLVRDHENEDDYYATQVQTESGQVIGWVPRQKSPEVAAWLELDRLVLGMVASRGGKDLLGVNIDITLVAEHDREWVEESLETGDVEAAINRRENPEPEYSVAGNSGCLGVLLLLCAFFIIVAIANGL